MQGIAGAETKEIGKSLQKNRGILSFCWKYLPIFVIRITKGVTSIKFSNHETNEVFDLISIIGMWYDIKQLQYNVLTGKQLFYESKEWYDSGRSC